MKTRNKIILIPVITITAFFVWPVPYNGICNVLDNDPLDNYDPCPSRISGVDIPGIGMLQYDSTRTMIDYESKCEMICEDRK